jgi:zinc finger MYND domain-containing protein 10
LFKLYHEATLVNLLETVLYHQDVCLAVGDSILDLVDYCYRKLTEFIQNYEPEKYMISKNDNKIDAEPLEELKIQNEKIEFDVVMKCLTIARYIIDNLAQ